MKKFLSLIFILVITCSAALITGCKGGISAIDMSVYFESPASVKVLSGGVETSRSINLDLVTAANYDTAKMDKYDDFQISGNAAYVYKMYVEKVEFFVVTNKSSSEAMKLTFKMTNLAKETTLSDTNTFSETKEHIPEGFKPQKYTFYIGQTIATATGTTISIDISESYELLLDNSEWQGFKWQLYGLKIYGEHREYSN